MIKVLLTFGLVLISALYDLSAQGKLKEGLNMKDTWKNKWKNGDVKQGERFLGSSTFLVWLTDFFHFIKALFIFYIAFVIGLFLGYKYSLLFLLSWGILFEILYKVLKNKKG